MSKLAFSDNLVRWAYLLNNFQPMSRTARYLMVALTTVSFLTVCVSLTRSEEAGLEAIFFDGITDAAHLKCLSIAPTKYDAALLTELKGLEISLSEVVSHTPSNFSLSSGNLEVLSIGFDGKILDSRSISLKGLAGVTNHDPRCLTGAGGVKLIFQRCRPESNNCYLAKWHKATIGTGNLQ